jgi:hypothetical protein
MFLNMKNRVLINGINSQNVELIIEKEGEGEKEEEEIIALVNEMVDFVLR